MKLIGKKIHNYEVISFLEKIKSRVFYLCMCKCGKVFRTREDRIISKTNPTKSCGCLQKERTISMFKTHGKSNTVEYSTYKNILSRCYKDYATGRENYKNRNIKVCDRWIEGFENFLEDMGHRPSKEYSLDRINNNGNYSKENCRWATKKEQDNNKRNNRIIKYKNETGSISYFADKFKLSYNTLYTRIQRGKWTIDAAIEKPLCIGWKIPFVYDEKHINE